MPEQVNPVTPQQPATIVATNRPFNWKGVLLGTTIGLFLIAVGGMIFWYFTNPKKSETSPVNTTKPATSSSTTTNQTNNNKSDVTKNWSVYKNTKVGFEFKYPQRFQKPRITSTEPPYLVDATGEEDNNDAIIFGENSETGFLLGILPEKQEVTLNDIFDASLASVPTEAKNSFEKTDIVVDGIKGLRVKVMNKTVSVYFLTSTHLIELNMNMPSSSSAAATITEDESSAIISSFKFQEK